MEQEEAPELPVIDPEEVEVFDVEDVCDIGSGEPLFSCFTFEDWALLGIRFELQLLLLAFKKDLDDPERTNFHESHLPFYYGKYFKKQLNMRFFGTDKVSLMWLGCCESSHVLEFCSRHIHERCQNTCSRLNLHGIATTVLSELVCAKSRYQA